MFSQQILPPAATIYAAIECHVYGALALLIAPPLIFASDRAGVDMMLLSTGSAAAASVDTRRCRR